MGGPDRLHHQRTLGPVVGPETVTRDLRCPVQSADAGTDRPRCGLWQNTLPCGHHRSDDAAIARAAAKDAAKSGLDLGLAGRRVHGQKFGGGKQHPRSANAALRRPMRLEAGAKAGQLPRRALDGGDVAPLDAGRWRQARADRRTIHQHGAGPAIACVAANLGPGLAQTLTQDLGQTFGWWGVHRHDPTVERETDHAVASATARRTSSVAANFR